jgi:uncharacterized membrane protein YqjE
MENKFFKMFKLDGVFENAKGYIDSRIQLFKLEIEEKLSRLLSALLISAIVLFLSLLVLIFFSLALGNYINELLESSYAGFSIVGIMYLLLIGITFSVRKTIQKKTLQLIMNILNKS